MKTTLLTVLTCSLLLGAEAPKDDAKKEKEKLQGTWKALKVEERGESKDDDQDHRLIFSGDEFTIKEGDQTIIKGKFKIDPSKAPKEIDMEITESNKEEHKGKTGLGIYTLEGDDFQFCVCQPGDTERPKEFSGKGNLFVTFKREKKP
jgi:uncharacterized protein (TIGR03067 family)